jgi:hypothetical protein
MNDLRTIREAAPQFKKTEAAMRWWLAQESCPLRVARIGGRLFLRQSEIDRIITEAFAEAS